MLDIDVTAISSVFIEHNVHREGLDWVDIFMKLSLN
jgi:hypothetical protein